MFLPFAVLGTTLTTCCYGNQTTQGQMTRRPRHHHLPQSSSGNLLRPANRNLDWDPNQAFHPNLVLQKLSSQQNRVTTCFHSRLMMYLAIWMLRTFLPTFNRMTQLRQRRWTCSHENGQIVDCFICGKRWRRSIFLFLWCLLLKRLRVWLPTVHCIGSRLTKFIMV